MSSSITNKDAAIASTPNDSKHNSRAPRVHKAKDYVALIVTALPLFGAIGTIFVWIFCSVYVGNVELTSSKPFRSVFVQVFNEKGNECEFHSPRFQLMPGDYLLQVSVDGQLPTKYSAIVKLHKKILIPLEVNKEESNKTTIQSVESIDDQLLDERPKKRWWQFWRK